MLVVRKAPSMRTVWENNIVRIFLGNEAQERRIFGRGAASGRRRRVLLEVAQLI